MHPLMRQFKIGIVPIFCLLIFSAPSCARHPALYDKQLNRAVDSSYQGQELLSEGKDQRAEKAFAKSLEINRSIDNPVGTSQQLNNLAAVALTRGDLSEAKKLFQQALFFNQEIHNTAGAAINLANLATVAQKGNNLPLAEGYLQEARDLAGQSGSARVKGQVLCQMAGLELDRQDNAAAAGLLEEAKPYAREAEVRGSWNYQQGRFFLAGGDTVQALQAFQDALAADKNILNRSGMGADLQGLGKVWEERGDYGKAFLYYSRAFELYAATKSLEKARFCLETLRRLNRAGGLGLSINPYEQQLGISQPATAPSPPPDKTAEPGKEKILPGKI